MFLIRKKLSAAEILPANRRYNPTTDTFEYTPDGGTTWVEDPASDPRHSDIFRLPALTGEDARCDAAARIAAAWEETLNTFIQSVNAAQFAVAVLTLILLFLGPVGVLLDAALTIGGALILIGVSNIAAAFTTEVWEQITCIIYDHIGADGQVSAAQSADIMTDINAQFSSVISGTLGNLVQLYGEVLMSNAGVERDETGDCSGCDGWCFEIFFDVGDGAFVEDAINGPGANYSSGVGWIEKTVDVTTGTYIQSAALTPTIFTHVEFDYIAFEQTTSAVIALGLAAGFPVVEVEDGVGNTLTTVEWDGAQEADIVYLQIGNSVTGTGGTSIISRVLMRGTGTNPFGGDNC